VRRVEHLCDSVISISSFAGSGGDMSGSEFSDYDGILQLQRLPLLHCLSPSSPPDTLHYLFRMRRRTMALEKLSLPPELSRSDAPVNLPEQQLVGLSSSHRSLSPCSSIIMSVSYAYNRWIHFAPTIRQLLVVVHRMIRVKPISMTSSSSRSLHICKVYALPLLNRRLELAVSANTCYIAHIVRSMDMSR
jgi:hypothetical protein